MLLDRGVKLDLQESHSATALFIASQNGYSDVVKLLLDKGAKTELKTLEGKKGLDYAINSDIETLLTETKRKQ
jgi:ankyrin repeat protein